MAKRDIQIGSLLLCGGLTKIDLFAMTMADSIGLPVIIPHNKEAVLLGSAMLGANASERFSSLSEVMSAMGGHGRTIQPNMKEKA